jgi:hypothetical protein
MCMFMSYVYMPEKEDVSKPSRVHMGHDRPKINNVTVEYWQLNEKWWLIFPTCLLSSFHKLAPGFCWLSRFCTCQIL